MLANFLNWAPVQYAGDFFLLWLAALVAFAIAADYKVPYAAGVCAILVRVANYVTSFLEVAIGYGIVVAFFGGILLFIGFGSSPIPMGAIDFKLVIIGALIGALAYEFGKNDGARN